MTMTSVSDVSNQVQKVWGGTFMDELMSTTLLPSLVNKDFEGALNVKGDTVYVSQITRPTAQRKKVGSGHEYFTTQKLEEQRIAITCDQVISAGYEFDSLVQLQSQIGDQDSKIRQGLLEAYAIELNNYLYSLVSPSTSAPDHSVASVGELNAAALIANRVLAGQAKWSRLGGWFGLIDPSYMGDIFAAATLTSNDYVPDAPVVGGQTALKRFGFNLLEDNSDGLLTLSPAGAGVECGLFFHPDFMHLAHQVQPEFEVSSLHSNKQFGYVLSVRAVVGAKLGIDGDVKHIVNYDT
jgi:hypothetical protein